MYIEIVTPEAVLFKGEVKSVSVPSVNGQFQILEHHADIIAILEKGFLKVQLDKKTSPEICLQERFQQEDSQTILLEMTSGVVEQKNGKIILLID